MRSSSVSDLLFAGRAVSCKVLLVRAGITWTGCSHAELHMHMCRGNPSTHAAAAKLSAGSTCPILRVRRPFFFLDWL